MTNYAIQKRLQILLQSRKNNNNLAQSGFSLIELIIVIAVLATLTAIALPAFNNVARNARSTNAKASLSNAYKECEVSRADTGAAAHTPLANAGGVTFTQEALLATCTSNTVATRATATTSDGCVYTVELANGTKTASAPPCAQW